MLLQVCLNCSIQESRNDPLFLLGVIVIYGIPWLREIPIAGAEWIARLGSERKWLAIIYILGAFFGIPGALVFASAWLS